MTKQRETNLGGVHAIGPQTRDGPDNHPLGRQIKLSTTNAASKIRPAVRFDLKSIRH